MSRSSKSTRALAALALATMVWGCPPQTVTNESHANRTDGQAENGQAVPSCYAAVAIGVPAPRPERAVFVLVDQTTGLDDRLRATITRNLERLLSSGTTFTVATFSAFSGGNFTTVIASGTIEAPLTEDQRLHLQADKVEQIGQCLEQQRAYGVQVANRTVSEATSAASASFSNSEILASLRQLSEAVRASTARERVVIVVSDLLEHSAVTSFYRNRDMRQIDPAAEMRLVAERELVADFGGARVAVIGAGLHSPDAGVAGARQTPKLDALRDFWEQWFERSNARLVAYGQPDLVAPIPN